MKIYTKKGDGGETSLIFGQRVSKDDLRIQSVGALDELNASLGVAISLLKDKKILEILLKIQNELFNIGAEIASPKKLKKGLSRQNGGASANTFYILEKEKIEGLEKEIDQYEENLPELRNFILPSGAKSGAQIHLSRTVCRRAERKIVTLSKKIKVNPNVLKYLNRLSDLLFVLARTENLAGGQKEVEWQKD